MTEKGGGQFDFFSFLKPKKIENETTEENSGLSAEEIEKNRRAKEITDNNAAERALHLGDEISTKIKYQNRRTKLTPEQIKREKELEEERAERSKNFAP